MKKKKTWLIGLAVLAVLIGTVSAFLLKNNKNNGKGSAGLADGTYQLAVRLEGGSGRASIDSPARVRIRKGAIRADITWSSAHYDYMVVGGKKYKPVSYADADTHSRFEIPVPALDQPFPVKADTTAMSTPHEISYKITVYSKKKGTSDPASSSGSGDTVSGSSAAAVSGSEGSWKEFLPRGYTVTETRANTFAKHFLIRRLKDSDGKEGYSLLSLSDGSQYLIAADGSMAEKAKKTADRSYTVLAAPLKQGYLAATACMAHFVSLDALDSLTDVGAAEEYWSIREARQAMADGRLSYAGKYSAPQYEQLLQHKTRLAIESTMILHTPAVREKLEELGIPVLMDQSSYESEPMGRAEWIRVYGLLTGKEAQAEKIFDAEVQRVRSVESEVGKLSGTRKTVAFFSIDSQGRAVVRKGEDYIPKMISTAGGTYVFSSLKSTDPGSHSGSVTLSMEKFYAEAKDADLLIYNSAIEEPVKTREQLIRKSPTLADFKAVKQGNVWNANASMYQASDSTADCILDLHRILTGGKTETGFFTRVK